MMIEHGRKAGFTVPEPVSLRNLRNHCIITPGLWANALELNKQTAIAVTDQANDHRYLRYPRGCQYISLSRRSISAW